MYQVCKNMVSEQERQILDSEFYVWGKATEMPTHESERLGSASMGGCCSRHDSAAASAFTPRGWVRLARVPCWNHPWLLRVAHGKQDGALCRQALWFLPFLLPHRTLCSGTVSFTWVQSTQVFCRRVSPIWLTSSLLDLTSNQSHHTVQHSFSQSQGSLL